jgi:hypothetical protein
VIVIVVLMIFDLFSLKLFGELIVECVPQMFGQSLAAFGSEKSLRTSDFDLKTAFNLHFRW